MSTEVRGLIVDDDEVQVDLIAKALDLEFETFDWRVRWENCGSALGARSMVRGKGPFDFAIIDYDLGPDQQNGPVVVREIRTQSGPDTLVIVVTGKADVHPDYGAQATRAGANHAINRRQLVMNPEPGVEPGEGWDFGALSQRIRRHVLARRESADISFSRDDLGMQSILENIGQGSAGAEQDPVEAGERIVRSLVIECFAQRNVFDGTFRVEYLTPGRSGALVCRVTRTQLGGPDEAFVIKLGLDRISLVREQRLNRAASEVLGPDVLIPVSTKVVTHGPSGYSAFLSRLASTATLGSWLAQATPWPGDHHAKDVQEAADVLFGEHLRPLFQPSLRVPGPTVDWMRMSSVVRMRVHQVMSIYDDLWRWPEGGNRTDVSNLLTVLQRFVDDQSLPAKHRGRLGQTVLFVGGFGDLHSSNVLVHHGVHVRPTLVDASLYGKYHWATDAARLVVDLVLRVWQPRPESMLWAWLPGAYSYVDYLCPYARRRATLNPREATEAFIDRILERYCEFLLIDELGVPGPAWHWQWHVALAREFLRQGSRTDVMPPRAILALTAASSHLLSAGRVLDYDY